MALKNRIRNINNRAAKAIITIKPTENNVSATLMSDKLKKVSIANKTSIATALEKINILV
jgi:hypothetical protein